MLTLRKASSRLNSARDSGGCLSAAAGNAKAEIVEDDGRRAFRLAKAIPTGEVRLPCHGGGAVTPEVEAKLAEFHPA